LDKHIIRNTGGHNVQSQFL